MRRYRAYCSALVIVTGAICITLAGLAFNASVAYADERDAINSFEAGCKGIDTPACNWACVPSAAAGGAGRVCAWCTSPPDGSGDRRYCVNSSGAVPIGDDGTCALPTRADGCSDCMYDAHDAKVLIGACAAVAAITWGLACANCCSCSGACAGGCVWCCRAAGGVLTVYTICTMVGAWTISKGLGCDACARCCCGRCDRIDDGADDRRAVLTGAAWQEQPMYEAVLQQPEPPEPTAP